MKVGQRIYFNQTTGVIIASSGEIDNAGSERPVETIGYIDLPHGFIDLSKGYVSSIEVETNEPVVVYYGETDEQRRIRELEDTLLLQTDNELGGIL